MSWTTRITKAPNGELRLLFPEPLSHLDMDRATAKRLAALIVDAAEGPRIEPFDAQATSRIWSAAELVERRRGCLMSLCIHRPLGEIPPANEVAQ